MMEFRVGGVDKEMGGFQQAGGIRRDGDDGGSRRRGLLGLWKQRAA